MSDEKFTFHLKNYIGFLKEIKKNKNYKLSKFFLYSTHIKSPHIIFYSNPLKYKGDKLSEKINNLKKSFIKIILSNELCTKNNLYKNPIIIDIIISQIKKCISNREYWKRYGFVDYQAEQIILLYKMLLNFYKEYKIICLKKYNRLGFTSNGKKLYELLIKINTSMNLNVKELQFFAIRNLNIQIKKLEKLLNIQLQNEPITRENLFPSEDFINFIKNNKLSGTPILTEKDLLVTSMKIINNLHEKTKKLFNKSVNIPKLSSINIKPIPKLVSAWSSKGKADKNCIYLNTDNLYKYRKESLFRLLAHESIPGHLLERRNNIKIVESLNIPKDVYFLALKGVKMLKEGWAVYAEHITSDKNNIVEQKYLLLNKIFYCIRTIIDIGLNYNGMKIEVAKQLLENYTSLHENSIDAEIARYIGNPTQACSYMLGILYYEILENEYKKKSNDMITFYSKIVTTPLSASELFKYILQI